MGTSADAAAGLRGWFIAAAVIGVLNAAVAAAYYLRLVAVIYFRGPEKAGKGDRSNLCAAPSGPFRQIGPVPFSGLGPWGGRRDLHLLLVAIGVYPGLLMEKANDAAAASRQYRVRSTKYRARSAKHRVRSAKDGERRHQTSNCPALQTPCAALFYSVLRTSHSVPLTPDP